MARIAEPERCWGCGACLKACPHRALGLKLPTALGGRGLVLTVMAEDPDGRQPAVGGRTARLRWQVRGPDGFFREIVTEPERKDGY